MLPVVAAFVVGVMLGPAARRLEALHVPRPLVALLLVAGVTSDTRFRDPVDRSARVRARRTGCRASIASLKEKLHVFDGLVGAWRRLAPTMLGEPSSGDSDSDSFARDFLGAVDDLAVVAADYRAFCSFSSCCFCSSRNGRTCGAASS